MSNFEEETPVVRVRDLSLGEQICDGTPRVYKDIAHNATQELIDNRHEENAAQYRNRFLDAMASNNDAMPEEFCLDRRNTKPLAMDVDELQKVEETVGSMPSNSYEQQGHAHFVSYVEAKLLTYEQHLEYMMAEKLLIKLGITHKEIEDIVCTHGNCYSDAWVNQFQFDNRMDEPPADYENMHLSIEVSENVLGSQEMEYIPADDNMEFMQSHF